MFSQNFKMRYTNILQKTGLDGIFKKISESQTFPESVVLQDVVINIIEKALVFILEQKLEIFLVQIILK